MGLDMYLTARKFNRTQYKTIDGVFTALPKPEMDGFEVQQTSLNVCYWRKNHWLHGYMVETFADGEDNCKPIPLMQHDLAEIADRLEFWAENPEALSATEGFFFGTQDDEWRDQCRATAADDAAQIRKLIQWLNDEPTESEWREVEYQASW